MSFYGNKEFFLEVAKGNVPGHTFINKFGHNSAVAVTGEDIWTGGGTYAFYPTSAQTMEILSSEAADDGDPAGTGARTVTIFGLDANWDLQSETVTLNGTTVVTLSNTYIRVYRAYVVTAGSAGTNVGNITVRIETVGTVAAYIAAGDGQTQQAIYTIPNGYTGYFLKGYSSMSDDDKNGEVAEVAWKVRIDAANDGAWQTKGQVSLSNIGGSWFSYEYGIPPGPLPEKTDVRMECILTTAEMGVTAAFDILLVADGY